MTYDQTFKWMSVGFWAFIVLLALIGVFIQFNYSFQHWPQLQSAEEQCQRMNEAYHAKWVDGELYCLVPVVSHKGE